MNLTQVKNDIKARKFSPMYIFTGEEIGVMNIYIEQMAKAKKCEIVRADTFKEIWNVLSSTSLLAKSKIFVCRDDAEIINDNAIHGLIDHPAWIHKDTVILVFTNLDKRKSFYKQFKDKICEFESLDDAILSKYIKKSIPMSDNSCKKLIEACEHSYSRIMLEVDKIKQYTVGMDYTQDDKVYNHVLNELLENGVIYQPAQDSIFLWSDAVMYRKKEEAFKLTDICFRSGEAVLTMLTVLYNNVKQTLQLKACDSSDVSKTTGLTGWQIQCAKKFINSYSVQELLNALELIREMETGIKTGKIEEQAVISNILVNML